LTGGFSATFARLLLKIHQVGRAPAPLLVGIRDERRVRPLLMSPNRVRDLDRTHRINAVVEEHEQSSQVDRINARVLGPCTHHTAG
jgi:hypothetical protein